jgi:hypothetical protein
MGAHSQIPAAGQMGTHSQIPAHSQTLAAADPQEAQKKPSVDQEAEHKFQGEGHRNNLEKEEERMRGSAMCRKISKSNVGVPLGYTARKASRNLHIRLETVDYIEVVHIPLLRHILLLLQELQGLQGLGAFEILLDFRSLNRSLADKTWSIDLQTR